MKKLLALIFTAVLILGAVPAIADDTAEAPGTEEAAAGQVAEETAIPTAEGSIFIAPLRPENAQPLMDLFAEINGEEGRTSFDLAMLLAGEENELSEDEINALKESLEGFNKTLSDGYLTDVGDAVIDAAALGLKDGDIVKGIVLNDGKPAVVEAEVADGVCKFEVKEPSVCFAFGFTKFLAIPTAEGSIFIAPLRPENAQPLMDLFGEINGEEGKTSFDLAMLLAGEENELSEDEINALKESLEGFNKALANGYLTDVGDAVIDAAALELKDGDIIKGIVLNGGKPAVVEAEAADGVCKFEVTEPSVCFAFSK